MSTHIFREQVWHENAKNIEYHFESQNVIQILKHE